MTKRRKTAASRERRLKEGGVAKKSGEFDGAAAFPIVGIGASAGGLEAFTQLLGALPLDTGMAFVLVQHLDPEHESALTQILSRSTALPVREIQDNETVEANHVYVIPRDTNLRIDRGRLKISPRPRTRVPHRPIDIFFESLAQDRRERAVGVVLSGTGSDGTLGLESIKAEGGITFAQDDSAKHDSMPHSAAASGSVDLVLSPAEIAQELARYAKHPFVAGKWPLSIAKTHDDVSPEDDRAFATAHEDDETPLSSGGHGTPGSGSEQARTEARRGGAGVGESKAADGDDEAQKNILLLLRNHAGVDFTLYKSSTIQRRIARRVLLSKHDTLRDYAAFLRGNAKELDSLYSDVLISVTSFFRNPETFEVLEGKVLPELLKKGSDDPFRCWVLGCSTGQEAYSIAIAFVEAAEKAPRMRRLQIFATDLNEALLDKARHGLYTTSLVEDISPQRLRRFFVQEEGGYRISKALREMVVFARQNFIADPPFARMDLISCRNLLIYLDAGLQRKAIPTFHYALKPRGILLLGASESIGPFTDLFEPVDKKHKIYSRKAVPVSSIPLPLAKERREEHTRLQSHPAQAGEGPGLQALHGELNAQREADRITLGQFAPPGVLVNAELQVLQFRGPTGAFLEPPQGKASFNVLKMAREGLMLPLRSAISQARKENKSVRKDNVRVERDGETRTVNLQVIPLKNLRERSFLILFKEPEKEGSKRRRSELRPTRPRRAPAETLSRSRELDAELTELREYLQTMQDQHEAANEELQAASEEVQSANEELQSVNEELETSKEELESANEELTTVNEELQNRNSEVNRLNSDLTNLQNSAKFSIVLVGRDLTIRRFSLQAEKQFNLVASHAGRPINQVRHGLYTIEGGAGRQTESPLDLERLAAEVIAEVTEQEREVLDREGRWHSLRVRPYMTHDNKVEGAVIVLVNIDVVKRSEEAIAAARDYAENVVETVREPLLVLDKELNVERANGAFYRTFRVAPAAVVGRKMYELGNHEWDIPRLRELLEDITAHDTSIEDFEVKHDFESLGRRTMMVNARRIHDGQRANQRILVAIEDVSDRQSAAAANSRLAAIVESSDDAIVSKTLDGVITSWNRGAEKLFGYTEVEAIGRHISLIIPVERQAEEDEVIARIRRGESVSHFDTERQAKDGRRISVSLTVSPIRNFSGQVVGVSKVARDVSERKLLEQSLRQHGIDLSEAADRKNEFLAMLGHELRNPLSALSSGLDLLRRMPDDPVRRGDLGAMMARQTKRMTVLLDQLLDIARVISSKIQITKERVFLADVVRAGIEGSAPLMEAQKHKLTLDLAPDHDMIVMGDPIRLTQVVENLLTNAAKYTDAGGEITLTVAADQDTVRIVVKDNGIGMSADLIPHVFEVFTQAPRTLDRAKGGLGLGLPLVRRIVELHGGHVSASSPGPGEGSEFVVTLPRVLELRSTDRREHEQDRGALVTIRPRRILVVDDEEDARETLAALLKADGHETLAVHDGATALEAVRTFQPEAVLLDLGLPNANGYEVARKLRDEQANANMLLVAVTGYRSDPVRLKAAGFDHHLIKPASSQQVSALLTAWDQAGF